MPSDPWTRPLAVVETNLVRASQRRHDLLAERNVKQDQLVAMLHNLDAVDRSLASVNHEIDSLLAERERAITNQSEELRHAHAHPASDDQRRSGQL